MSDRSSSGVFTFAAVAGGLAAAGLAAAWWLRRPARSLVSEEPNEAPALPPSLTLEALEPLEAAPDSFTFEPTFESSPEVTARPSDRASARLLFDDNDALDADDLGAAFLAGATDTALDEPPSSTAELSGFQIYDSPEQESPPADE